MAQSSPAPAESVVGARAPLVGNRLVLAGAVLYLLEWVAIGAGQVSAPVGGGASASALHDAYSGHAGSLGWAAGWFSVVLLGRILLMVGLRAALTASGRPHPLMDLAVAAMTVSVTLEIATYAMVAGGAWVGPSSALRTLDGAAFVLDDMIWGPAGVSLLCAGAAMWFSGLFNKLLSGLALVAGVLITVAGLVATGPSQNQILQTLTAAALLMWIWMLWTGVVVWRATPARTARG
jgi:hypothetical protein